MIIKPLQNLLHAFTGQGTTAGVVLGYTSLLIVLVKQTSEKKNEILRWGKEDYGNGVTRNSPEFPEVLKDILTRFLGQKGGVRIWCTIQSKGVETRHLLLPEMPERHLPKAVLWAFKKEVNLGDEPTVFDYEITGIRDNRGKRELEIMACSAPEAELQAIKQLFRKAGYPVCGITVTSFAFQNLFRTGFAGGESRNIGTLFIGADWSRIDLFSDGNLVLSRDIKTGTRSMAEVLFEHREAEPEAEISLDVYLDPDDDGELTVRPEQTMVQGPEPENMNPQMMGAHFIDLIHGKGPQTPDQVFTRILPVVDRLVRQIERTFEHFSMTNPGHKIERLYLTGPLCAFGALMNHAWDQLGIPVLTINPFTGSGEGTSETPEALYEQDEFVPATGLALSRSDRTMNFDFTYEDKAWAQKNRILSRVLVIAIVGLLITGAALHISHRSRINTLDVKIPALTQELGRLEALFGKQRIIAASDTIRAVRTQRNIKARAHYGAALLAEISRLRQPDIAFSSFVYEKPEGGETFLYLKGLLMTTDRKRLDDFSTQLEASAIIKTLTLARVEEKEYRGRNVLYFESKAELYE